MTSLNFGSLRHVSLGNQVSLDYISVTLRRDVRQQLQLPRSQRLANVTPRVPALDLFLQHLTALSYPALKDDASAGEGDSKCY